MPARLRRISLVAGLLALAVCAGSAAADSFRYLSTGASGSDSFRFFSGGALLHFSAPEPTAPQLTNVQKLSLPTATAVGTQVIVTDAFQVTGAGSANGFWVDTGTLNGKRTYGLVGAGTFTVSSPDGIGWKFYNSGVPLFRDDPDADGESAHPWEVTNWISDDEAPLPTLVHPVTQQLVAASTAQGGMVVLGGTQDGIYTILGSGNGKSQFVLLGTDNNVDSSSVGWDAFDRFTILNPDGDPLYYSLSDVATPDLATDWKNASDDTPAAITVTSVTQGELDAGLFVTNDGVTNGSSYVSQPFHGRQYYMGLNGGGSNNMHWDTDYNVWTDDAGVWTADNVAFPWQGTDNHTGHNGATFIRNDIANESNWQIVP